MIGMFNHLLSIVLGFHYHAQQVIGSLGASQFPLHSKGPKAQQTNQRFAIYIHSRSLTYIDTQKWPYLKGAQIPNHHFEYLAVNFRGCKDFNKGLEKPILRTRGKPSTKHLCHEM